MDKQHLKGLDLVLPLANEMRMVRFVLSRPINTNITETNCPSQI